MKRAEAAVRTGTETAHDLDPFRLVSDEEYNKNLNLIIAYYQMTRGEAKRRFTGSHTRTHGVQ
jgi:hypothetical protein